MPSARIVVRSRRVSGRVISFLYVKMSGKRCPAVYLRGEQIDHLTRLSNSDWITLKKQIEQHELRIVSLDVSNIMASPVR